MRSSSLDGLRPLCWSLRHARCALVSYVCVSCVMGRFRSSWFLVGKRKALRFIANRQCVGSEGVLYVYTLCRHSGFLIANCQYGSDRCCIRAARRLLFFAGSDGEASRKAWVGLEWFDSSFLQRPVCAICAMFCSRKSTKNSRR